MLEPVGEGNELADAVEFAALAQGPAPREDRRDGIGRGRQALEVLVVMPLHRAVRGFVLVVAMGADEHARHHREAAKGARDHVAHHVTVVVLAGPDETALGLHDARDGVVDEGVEVLDAGLLETRAVLGIEDVGEDVLEAVVVDLRDRVLGRKPQVLADFERVLEAAARKALDGGIEVVLTLHDAGAGEFVHQGAHLLAAVGRREDEFDATGAVDAHLGVLVDVAIGVTGERDGLLPAAHAGFDALDDDGGPKDGAVEQCADRAVGALPHLLETVFVHARGIRRNGCAFDGDAQALGRLGGIDGDLVVRLVAVLEAEVVVLGLEVDMRNEQLRFDQLPDDAGHLVAVHLDKRGLHLDFAHVSSPVSGCVMRQEVRSLGAFACIGCSL